MRSEGIGNDTAEKVLDLRSVFGIVAVTTPAEATGIPSVTT